MTGFAVAIDLRQSARINRVPDGLRTPAVVAIDLPEGRCFVI